MAHEDDNDGSYDNLLVDKNGRIGNDERTMVIRREHFCCEDNLSIFFFKSAMTIIMIKHAIVNRILSKRLSRGIFSPSSTYSMTQRNQKSIISLSRRSP